MCYSAGIKDVQICEGGVQGSGLEAEGCGLLWMLEPEEMEGYDSEIHALIFFFFPQGAHGEQRDNLKD